MKKLISILLIFVLLFSFCFSVNAEEGNINTIDMDFVALSYNIPESGSSSATYDVTSETQVSVFNTYGEKYGMIQYKLPLNEFSTKRLVATLVLSDDFSFNSNHEYNLKFEYSAYYQLPLFCAVQLMYYDFNNNLIKEQDIFYKSLSSNQASDVHSVDIDFKPDISDIESGYKCKLSISLDQNQAASYEYQQSFFLSPQIELIDKDDDSGWFQKILNKINDVWVSVKSIPDKIGNKIAELKDSISIVINNLKDNLIEGIKSLFTPRDNFFNDKLTELEDFFNSKFGVFALPFTLIIEILQLYNNVGNGSGILHLKEFKIDNNVFWSARDINLKQLILDFSQELYNDCGIDLYSIYLAFIDVIILFAFVRLIKSKYDKMMGSGAFEMPKDIMNEKGKVSNVDKGAKVE